MPFGRSCAERSPRSGQERLLDAIDELSALLADSRAVLPTEVAVAADLLVRCLDRGGKILVCGNGGSAADAQHFAAELVGRFGCERHPLAALSLTTDSSALTALANDYGAQSMFARQVVALGRPNDALVVISTSGRSANIRAAAVAAKREGLSVVALLGATRETMDDVADICLAVPCDSTPRIQEVHTLVLHCLADTIECALCQPNGRE